MMKEVDKGEIPNWDFGNVILKTFSYGHTMLIGDMVESVTSIVDGKEVKKYEVKEGYKESDLNILMAAAGVHAVRKEDGVGFHLSYNSTLEDKKNFIFNLDISSVMFLLEKIKELNDGITEQLKKR